MEPKREHPATISSGNTAECVYNKVLAEVRLVTNNKLPCAKGYVHLYTRNVTRILVAARKCNALCC